MHYNFPEIKNKPASLIQQLNKIIEEASEAIKARDEIERDYEIMDLLHACETYLRMRESQGIDLEKIKSFVISKNKQRGYYKEE